jgi:starch synthase
VNILFLASEVTPFSKTGGLADVAGALPAALARRGHQVTVVSPRYPSVRGPLEEGPKLKVRFPWGALGAQLRLVASAPGLTHCFVDTPEFFDRPGLYGEGQREYADSASRFAFFTRAALEGALALGPAADIVHCNDWQTGLAPLWLRRDLQGAYGQARSVMTIHNLAYQGNFSKYEVGNLGLSWGDFTFLGFEFWDQLSFLKAGLVYADALSTVSPSYAQEICTPGGGFGLDGVLRQRAGALVGILNGIDDEAWNPATDAALSDPYGPDSLDRKVRVRAALLERLRLSDVQPGRPLFGHIGRMVYQKGADLLQAALPPFLEAGAGIAVLGSGEAGLEAGWHRLAARFPGRVSVTVGHNDDLAHQLEAGVDAFLMPSRFEPCGLNQMYSLRYGTVPVVSAVGGLRDTVVDAAAPGGDGFLFWPPDVGPLRHALGRTLEAFAQPHVWRDLQRQGMSRDFSWREPAARYEALYERLRAG